MELPIKFGIIGCGKVSSKHIEALNKLKNAKLVAICDNNKKKVDILTSKYNVKSYYDYNSILNDQDINVICICTPSGLHAQMAIDAAKAGKHVITEKPMALSLEDADKTIEECKNNNVRLFVIKQNRYNPPIQQLKRALDEKRFGKLVLINTTVRWCRPQEYYDQDAWRGTIEMDGGVLMNQASHHIDLVRWLGGDVKSVFAKIAIQTHNINVEDTGLVLLKFKNGALGVIEATTCAYPKNLEGSITVLGEKGSVKVGGPVVNKLEMWEFKDYRNDDEVYTKHSITPPNVYGFGHIEVYKNIIGSLINNKDPLIDGIEGRKTLQLILAIYESARTGKEVFLD